MEDGNRMHRWMTAKVAAELESIETRARTESEKNFGFCRKEAQILRRITVNLSYPQVQLPCHLQRPQRGLWYYSELLHNSVTLRLQLDMHVRENNVCCGEGTEFGIDK